MNKQEVESGSPQDKDAETVFTKHIAQIPKPLQKRELRFIRVERKPHEKNGCKRPHDNNWTTGFNYSYDHPELKKWIVAKNNFGVVTGVGNLCVVDTDSCVTEKAMFDAIEKGDLPETFIVKTRGGHHFYFFLPEKRKKIVLSDIEIVGDGSYRHISQDILNDNEAFKAFKQEHRVEHAGEIQGDGQQVVGPNCVHRTGAIYQPINSTDIAHTTMGELMAILGDFLPKEEDDGFVEVFGKENRDLPNISKYINTAEVRKKNSKGDTYQGTHPVHGSTTGTNFTVNASSNTWYCFRHNTGGGFLDFVAMKEGIIPCTAGRKKVNEQLRKSDPKTYEKILKVARKKYGLLTVEKNYTLERSKMDEYQIYKYNDDGEIKGFNAHNAATYLEKEKLPQIITMEDSYTMRYYKEGVYHERGKNKILPLIEKLFKERSTEYYRREILEKIKLRTLFPREKLGGELRYINMNNGVFDIKTKTLLDHDAKYKFISKSPINYVPGATCPLFEELLETVIPDEDERKGLQEYMGYIFYRSMPFHKIFVFLGSGANGKGTVTDIISELVGDKDKTALPIRQFKKDWARAALFGTMLNVCGEISNKRLYDTDYLKRIRGGDLLNAKNLYEGPFQFRPYAKMIFSANALPPTEDSSSGFYRSFLFARFPKKFDVQERNVNIKKEIIASEMPGVFNFAMQGLYRLLENGFFSNERTMEESAEFYEGQVESISDYIYERLEITYHAADFEIRDEVYDDYFNWCKEQGRVAKNKIEFSRKLRKMFPNIIISGKPPKYKGLILKTWVEDENFSNLSPTLSSFEK